MTETKTVDRGATKMYKKIKTHEKNFENTEKKSNCNDH